MIKYTPRTDANVKKINGNLVAIGGTLATSETVSTSGGGSSEDWSSYEAQNNVDLNGYKLENLALPTSSGDAANKAYIDSELASLGISDYSTIFNKIQGLKDIIPDVILTTSGASDLNTAISNLTNGQTLEIKSSATFSPITLPSGIAFNIKVTDGYNPVLTGQECIKISDGASDILISSLIIDTCTTSYQNGKGSAITFAQNHSKASDLIFHNITIRNAQGSAILLAYYNGGDYATAPTLSQMSENISFISCHLHKATTDKIEGGALGLRGINGGLIHNCYIDSVNLGRGMHLQNSINLVVEKNYVNNCNDGNGGEGIKLDQLGTIVGYRNSAVIKDNVIKRCIEGIDIDDVTSCNIVQNNIVSECVGEGISLDDTGQAILTGNVCYNNNVGIRLESGAIANLKQNVCYNNTTDYLIQNGYNLDDSNTTSLDDTFIASHTSIVKNDSTVSGTTLKDALDVLNSPPNGTTGNRPTSPATGEFYFDTTLGIPIWYDSSNWVNASGTVV